MIKIRALLVLAVAVLAWPTNGRGGPLPEEELAAMKVNDHLKVSGYLPNPYVKLSAHLPDSEANISGNLPNDHLRISGRLPYSKANISGFLPYYRDKLSVTPDYAGRDELATVGINPHTKLSGFLPPSGIKISSQWPTPKTQ